MQGKMQDLGTLSHAVNETLPSQLSDEVELIGNSLLCLSKSTLLLSLSDFEKLDKD